MAIATLFVVTLVTTGTLAGSAAQSAREYTPSLPHGAAGFRGRSDVPRSVVAAAAQALDASATAEYRLAGLSPEAAGGLSGIQAAVRNPLIDCIEQRRLPSGSDFSVCVRESGFPVAFPTVAIAEPRFVELVVGRSLTGAELSAYRAGAALVLDRRVVRDGFLEVRLLGVHISTGDSVDRVPPQRIPAVTVAQDAAYYDLPIAVVSPSSAAGHDLRETSLRGVYFATDRMPTEAMEDRARALLDLGDGSGLLVVERGSLGERIVRQLLIVVAITLGLFTLAIVGPTVALSTVEMRHDLATLAAVGAAPRSRRRLAAAQAGILSGLGIAGGLVLGTVAAGGLVAAQSVPLTGVAWLYIIPAALATVVVAAATGYLASPRKLPMARRTE